MSLQELQRALTENAFSSEQPTTTRKDIGHYDTHEYRERMAIYRNNTLHSLREAVKELYPSLVATIGDDLMNASAHHYIIQHPPRSAAMVDFAHDFPEFLSTFSATQHIAYLPDLATLDLAQHRAYHAQDKSPLTAEAFAKLSPDILANARIEAHPSAQLIASGYAIYDMWKMAQGKHHETIQADKAQYIFIIRPDAEVDVYSIDHAHYQFLSALKNDHTISDALEIALETNPHINASEAIAFLIQCGFSVKILGA